MIKMRERVLGGVDVGKDLEAIFVSKLRCRKEMRVGDDLVAAGLVIAENHSHRAGFQGLSTLVDSRRLASEAHHDFAFPLLWIQSPGLTQHTSHCTKNGKKF